MPGHALYRLVLPVVFAGTLFIATAQNVGRTLSNFKSGPAPGLPVYDWNACPGEGCAYGRWTARKSIIVYNTWKQKRRILARLIAGEKVIGVTGVVITFRPGIIRMIRDVPEEELKRGDTILTYAYRGEGESAVWFNGRYYPDFDIGFTKRPDGAWCHGFTGVRALICMQVRSSCIMPASAGEQSLRACVGLNNTECPGSL